METVLSVFEYDFMKLALAATLIITPLFAILGTMVVNRRMAFFSDALGHSALTGMAIGVLFGVADTSVTLIIFAVAFALLMNFILERRTASADTIISVFSSLAVAVGLAILSRGGNFSKYSSLLVGDILSITKREVIYLGIVLAALIVFWVLCFNRLNAISISVALSKTRGFKVKLMENLFAVFVAVIVMLSIKWVGILIINALLVLPAAASRNISVNMREYHLFSIVFSMFSGITGLIFSYYTNVATGPMMIIVAAVIYFCTLMYHVGEERRSK